MNNQVIADSASGLFLAMRNRWRTGGASASLSAAQGHENAFAGSPGRRVRVRSLSENRNPHGVEIVESTYDCPFCDNFLSAKEYGEAKCGKCGRNLEEGKTSLAPMPKMTGCPKCGSHKIAGWMPTDFETAECEECGSKYEPKVADNQSREGQRFLHVDDCYDAFNRGWKASGIRDKKDYIKQEFVNQEKQYVKMTGKMDSRSRRIIYGESLQESSGQAANPDGPDYDPLSPEPRFLQMAKAELLRRRDLKCRDCGFTGLPASVDGHCPECGGLMDEPELQMTTAASSADQIRAAIRQQVVDRNQGLKRDNSTQEESVHASVPNHNHDIHLSDLVAHYGFRADGDHYVVNGDSDSRLYVHHGGKWIHQHHGVHHEGHGHKSLASHLSRHGNHRSER